MRRGFRGAHNSENSRACYPIDSTRILNLTHSFKLGGSSGIRLFEVVWSWASLSSTWPRCPASRWSQLLPSSLVSMEPTLRWTATWILLAVVWPSHRAALLAWEWRRLLPVSPTLSSEVALRLAPAGRRLKAEPLWPHSAAPRTAATARPARPERAEPSLSGSTCWLSSPPPS